MELLSPSFLAQLERFQLASRYRLAGELAGEHRSPRYGNTLDFADFREYNPGDDFRNIDYHVLARLDVLLVKLYEADDDLVVRLLVDISASMGMYGKLLQAKRLAAALGAVALTTNDAVTVHAFPSDAPPRRFFGRRSIPTLVDHLDGLGPGGTTPFVRAAGALLSRPGPAGLTVVISDLLTDQWRHAISRLRAGGSDLLVVHVLAPAEIEPDLLGDLELVDAETHDRVVVSLSSDQLRGYHDRVERWRTKVAARCREVGGGYLPVSADDDIERLLLTGWRAAGVLR